MDFFGVIITICLISSLVISNFIFFKSLKNLNLKLVKTKLLYFFISVLLLVLVLFLLNIFIVLAEDYLFLEISDFKRTILYRAILLLFVVFFYFIFQYLVNKLFIKKVNQKAAKDDYKEIGLDINE